MNNLPPASGFNLPPGVSLRDIDGPPDTEEFFCSNCKEPISEEKKLCAACVKEKALEESIEHWTRLATGTSNSNEYIGSIHCALCQLYYIGGCEGCPISTKTDQELCIDTPYDDVTIFVDEQYMLLSIQGNDKQQIENTIKAMPEFQRLAALELEFLKSLR